MKKYFTYSIIILLCLVLLPINVWAESKAGTLAEVRQELKNLESRRKAQNQKKAQTKSEMERAKQNIFKSQDEIKTNEKIIEDATIEITKLNIEIAQLKEEIKVQMNNEQITKGENIYLEYIFNSESYADLVYRYTIAEQIASYQNEKIGNWEQKIKQNKQLQIDLAVKEEELKQLILNLEKQVSYLGVEYEGYSDVLMTIDDEINSTKEYINYLVSIGCGENQDIASCLSINGDSSFSRPLIKGVVTSEFGYRTDPITGKKESYHNALDLGGNTEGTKIYASAAGKVAKVINASMSDQKCGGRQVFIHHNISGKLYTTAYYHLLSINVKVGDMVTKNSVIGTVGGGSGTPWDWCSTGPHLHFAIAKGWYGGVCSGDCYISFDTFKYVKSVNPRDYINFPTGRKYWYARY
ncbi:MAG: peptidoglycan DD-metalloendopeptidase family protein [Mollicutes bacterium]|nr:peptidoglycan DD-metalloendopeptidase family protein [Mollicutes bacterium]